MSVANIVIFLLSAVDTEELFSFSLQNYTALHCVVALLFSLGVTFFQTLKCGEPFVHRGC